MEESTSYGRAPWTPRRAATVAAAAPPPSGRQRAAQLRARQRLRMARRATLCPSRHPRVPYGWARRSGGLLRGTTFLGRSVEDPAVAGERVFTVVYDSCAKLCTHVNLALHHRVNSLNDELARLHRKLAEERKRWADANSKVLRAVEALGKASSASQLSTRARDVERAQKALADSDRKVADVRMPLARSRRTLGRLRRASPERSGSNKRRMTESRSVVVRSTSSTSTRLRAAVAARRVFQRTGSPHRERPHGPASAVAPFHRHV